MIMLLYKISIFTVYINGALYKFKKRINMEMSSGQNLEGPPIDSDLEIKNTKDPHNSSDKKGSIGSRAKNISRKRPSQENLTLDGQSKKIGGISEKELKIPRKKDQQTLNIESLNEKDLHDSNHQIDTSREALKGLQIYKYKNELSQQESALHKIAYFIINYNKNNINSDLIRTFKQKEELFYTYIFDSSHDLLFEGDNYLDLDKLLLSRIYNCFSVEYNVKEKRFIHNYSEENIYKFINANVLENCSNVKLLCKSNHLILKIFEYIKIQRFMKSFPELILLQLAIQDEPQKNLIYFLHFRSINLMLTCYFKDEESFPNFKETIIRLIENIVLMTRLRTCNIEKFQKEGIFINPCLAIHQNSYLPIFVYFFSSTARHRLQKKHAYSSKNPSILKHMKIVSLYLLYSNHLFNKYLSYQKYDKQAIMDFIEFLNFKNSCANCVMERCMLIICGTNVHNKESVVSKTVY